MRIITLAGSDPAGQLQSPWDYWISITAICKQSRRLLKSIKCSFLTQMIDSPTRRETLWDLLLTNTEKLIRDVKTGGSPGGIHNLEGYWTGEEES